MADNNPNLKKLMISLDLLVFRQLDEAARKSKTSKSLFIQSTLCEKFGIILDPAANAIIKEKDNEIAALKHQLEKLKSSHKLSSNSKSSKDLVLEDLFTMERG